MKMSLRVLIVLAAILGSGIGISAGEAAAPRRIEIEASKFSYSPTQITLKKGETVVLVLSSADVTHGLKIKELGIKVEAKKGHPEEVTVTPLETGHFEGKCSHFCGKGHGSMTLEINVVE
jgi:cytochrome c oxidase subunit 2